MNGTALLVPPAGPAPLLPAAPSRAACGGGPGVRTPARPCPPVVPPLAAAAGGGGVRHDAADTLAGLSGRPCARRAALPRGGEGPPPPPRPSHAPGVPSAWRLAPPRCPWSAPGRLRCPRPSGGVVSRSQRPPLGSPPSAASSEGAGGRSRSRAAHPSPPAGVGRPRVVPPRPQGRALGAVSGGERAWWGVFLSDRGGPSQRRGAWPPRGLYRPLPSARVAVGVCLATGLFPGGDASPARVWGKDSGGGPRRGP